MNNPLMYTDPSGEIVWLAFAVYGAWVMGVKAGIAAERAGGHFWKDGFWKGALVGFAAGALGGSGLAPFGTHWLGTTAWGAMMGAGTQAGTIWAMGGKDYSKIWQGALLGGAMGFMASEQFGNWVNGKGFTSNNQVLKNFEAGKYGVTEGGSWQQDALDYFGFKGEYIGGEGESHFWFNKNDPSKFGIRYSDQAFDSYNSLKRTYTKEIFHMKRFAQNGINGLELGNTGVFSVDRWPEERLGVIHQYRNQGLYPSKGMQFVNEIRNTEHMISSFNLYKDYNPSYYFRPYSFKPWHFIFKIPRLW